MKKVLPLNQAGRLPAWSSSQFVVGILCMCFVTAAHAQVHLVKDINTKAVYGSYGISGITDVNGVAYYCYRGNELWKSNGTAGGTVFIKRFASISDIKYAGNRVMLVANDSVHGPELWTTDGTAAGTTILKDIMPGTDGSSINSFCGVDSKTFFIANSPKKGYELWVTDGTASGTQMVKDIMKGVGNSNCRSLVSFQGKLYFVANNGTSGYEIHVSDGTTAGTHVLKEIRPGKLSSSPNYLTVSGNSIYFRADDDTNGQEVWKSDGTEDGTVVLKDVRPGVGSSFPDNFIDCSGRLYFRANDGVHGYELWTSDGTGDGTHLVVDLSRGKSNGFSWINGMHNASGALYFLLGRDVYRSYGTLETTQKVFETFEFYQTKELASIGSDFYVVDNTDTYADLMKINDGGVTFVSHVTAFDQGGWPGTGLATVGQKLFLSGVIEDENPYASGLITSDGTTAGTVLIIPSTTVDTQSSYPSQFLDLNGSLFFTAVDNSYFNTSNLWKTDGTTAESVQLTNLVEDAHVYDLFNNNGTVLVSVGNGVHAQVWKSDGTPAGTMMINDVSSTNIFHPSDFTLMNGKVYYSAQELFVTDGTAAGTMMVKNINPAPEQYYYNWSTPSNLTALNGNLIFVADDGVHGRELWKSDGTEAGTVLLKEITPGNYWTYFGTDFVVSNGRIYFHANDAIWETDGTAAGTIPVPGLSSLSAGLLMVHNGTVFFTASNPSQPSNNALWKIGADDSIVKVSDIYPESEGIKLLSNLDSTLLLLVQRNAYTTAVELWKSDGTDTGTVKVQDIDANDLNTVGTTINHKYYFVSTGYPTQIFRTDGTACGTYSMSTPGGVGGIGSAGNNVYLSMQSEAYGEELFAFNQVADVALCAPEARIGEFSQKDMKGGEDVVQVASYPNPFSGHFVINVSGTGKSYSAEIIQSNGTIMESHRGLERNKDYKVGQQLVNGLYLVRVVVDGRTITQRVVKQN